MPDLTTELYVYGAVLGLFTGFILGYTSGWFRGNQVAWIDIRRQDERHNESEASHP